MACYLKHIPDVIAEAGIELDTKNRRAVDHAIRRAVGKPEARCPEVWKEVKLWLTSGKRENLVEGLRREYRD